MEHKCFSSAPLLHISNTRTSVQERLKDRTEGVTVMLATGTGSLHSQSGGVSPFKTPEMFPFLINNDITKDIKDKLLNKNKI